jgi:hypothetical protein
VNNKNGAKIQQAKLGRTCHCCKKKINKGCFYLKTGYEQCYSNICIKCLKKFVLKIEKLKIKDYDKACKKIAKYLKGGPRGVFRHGMDYKGLPKKKSKQLSTFDEFMLNRLTFDVDKDIPECEIKK